MNEQERKMLEILRHNKGFEEPGQWIHYAMEHNFAPVRAEKLERCPGCGARPSGVLGQYVYYSTLVKLKSCRQCGLVYSDTRIDSQVIQQHFEQAYKDETYFIERRCRIFDQLAGVVDAVASRRAKVLDIGGAKGHLLVSVRQSRPDLDLWLNDLSVDACHYAARQYGFQVIPGGITDIKERSMRFDVVIMSDVIYYEPELKVLWDTLGEIVSEGGAVVIRVPNKHVLIRVWQFANRLMQSDAKRAMQSKIRFFNPEHLYVLSRCYLVTRLKGLGFKQVTTQPSQLLARGRKGTWRHLYYRLAVWVRFLSGGRLTITPSVLVVARSRARRPDSRHC